jgi:hypothetical protein
LGISFENILYNILFDIISDHCAAAPVIQKMVPHGTHPFYSFQPAIVLLPAAFYIPDLRV